MAQQLRALVALPEDQSWGPEPMFGHTHPLKYNSSSRGSNALWLLWVPIAYGKYVHRHTLMHIHKSLNTHAHTMSYIVAQSHIAHKGQSWNVNLWRLTPGFIWLKA